MISQTITFLYAIAQAIPSLASLCKQLITVLQTLDQKKNEAEAIKRLEDKNASVDAAIDKLPSKIEQQPKIDSKT